MIVRFIGAVIVLLFTATGLSYADASTTFTVTIVNAHGSTVYLYDHFVLGPTDFCEPNTGRYGAELAPAQERLFTCSVPDNFQLGVDILTTMTGDRNHHICDIDYDEEHFVSVLDAEGHCTMTRDGSTATVTLH